eukprot:2420564-Lingulodinium_polyedra.AAC.1
MDWSPSRASNSAPLWSRRKSMPNGLPCAGRVPATQDLGRPRSSPSGRHSTRGCCWPVRRPLRRGRGATSSAAGGAGAAAGASAC